jgi:hypothetical protein
LLGGGNASRASPLGPLRRTPEVKVAHLPYATDGALRGTTFFRQKFAADIGQRVFRQSLARVTALLRAVVHQSIFTDVKIAGAGAASPLVRQA